MTAPTIVGTNSGTSTFSGSGATVSVPSHSVGDLILVFAGVVEISGETQPGTHITGSTVASWNELGSGAECFSFVGTDPSVMLYAHWGIATAAGTGTLAINRDSGSATRDIDYAVITINGVDQTTPINASTLACGSGSFSTSVSSPGVTTSVADCLVFNAVQAGRGTGLPSFSSWSDGSMSGFAELFDVGTTTGDDRGLGGTSGVLASAGASGTVTATCSVSSLYSYITVAVAPGSISRGLVLGSMTLN